MRLYLHANSNNLFVSDNDNDHGKPDQHMIKPLLSLGNPETVAPPPMLDCSQSFVS